VSIASTANLSAADTITALLASEAALFRAVLEEPAPFVIAVYKDGSIRRLDHPTPE
jgi:hypothetical protein